MSKSKHTLNDFSYIDFRFTDLNGVWHHMTLSTEHVDKDLLKKGIAFDGSSLPGWKPIQDSDMLMMPDMETLTPDIFADHNTGIVICDVIDPVTHKPYERDPRSIAKRAEAYLVDMGLADAAFFGPEPEFFIFDKVQFSHTPEHSSFELFSHELPVSGGHAPGNGYRPGVKGGYMPCSPIDDMSGIRGDMLEALKSMGVSPEKHHHEVATAQHELGIAFNTLTTMADHLQIYKYVVHNVAHAHEKTATFMPKPLYGDNGSGMHVHQSLWRHGTPLFAGSEYADLSLDALYYIGGILKHAKALNAFTNPSTNSYKRLIPGFEAPVVCAYSARNRSSACRIPVSFSPKGRRIEIRFPDAMACGYLAFTAMLMAGLDGIHNKIHPGDAVEVDLFHDTTAAASYPTVSHSLRQALESLESDFEFLTRGSVMTFDFIKAYIDLKWHEVYAFEHAPHPIEFDMYYNR